MILNLVVLTFLLADSVAKLVSHTRGHDAASTVVSAVLEATSQPSCSLILLTDGVTSPSATLKAVSSERSSPRGVTVMEVTAAEDGQDANVTLAMLSHLVDQARQVRLGSWCVRVVVVSHDPAFLVAFAESSLKGRLLVWATRLLVVTSLTLSQLYTLLPAHWTFSMMNTIFLNLEGTSSNLRYRLYIHLPYSPDGARVVRVATWSTTHGIVRLTGLPIFPEKFQGFFGAKVNVTAQPWPPFWQEVEDKTPDGTVAKLYSGSDYLTLKTVSEALNFTINVVPTASWAEAARRVEERVSFMAAVYHVALPERWKQYGFTYIYEFNQASFSLAKPGLKPRWQSLYYPLTAQAWGAVLGVLIAMPVFFYLISTRRETQDKGSRSSAGPLTLEVMGILVGQNLPLRLHDISSSRLLVAAWLVFAFIIGTVYRGNLTAALTLPKYPPRPETIEELVDVIGRVTMPPFGEQWRKYYADSDSQVYKRLAQLMLIGPSIKEGLQLATEQNSATMTSRRYLANMIAEHFTEADGSTQLYLGRESIFPGPSGWPIPHDAPYKPQLDRCLMAIVEAGLYEKWNEDILRQNRRESQRRKRKQLTQQQQEEGTRQDTRTDSSITALTLTHMQGPLMLQLLGLIFAGILFIVEYLV
ncbi:LOW QUALITY PROTEIN: ionotropic receptor 21a-like [Panulirus ornatus]|uniref:LOW QUALITY PROTEIN: ionotropic receptor 21a-like n=1 Tax=Panulirus ornatus TaxID=150431 RepID=UPI003A84FA2C